MLMKKQSIILLLITTLFLLLSGCSGGGGSGDSTNDTIKANISSITPLKEDTLDGTVINITLYNTLEFADATLESSNFTLVGVPNGTSIKTVTYVDATHANLTLTFDGTNFDDNTTLNLVINATELNTHGEVKTNALNIEAIHEVVLGQNGVARAILTSQNSLEENSLDGAVLEISLTNGLKFSDSILEASNFILQKAPEGVSIHTVEYINQRDVKIMLAFDGTDINASKEISMSISKNELSSSVNIITNSLMVYNDIVSGYDDINETIQFHTSDHIPLGIEASENLTLSTLPREGNASVYKVGNEFWYLDYSHISCNLFDRIVYDSTNGKGKINIKVEMQLPDLTDKNISIRSGSRLYEYFLVDDENIESVYVYSPEHGTAEVIQKDSKYLLNYKPDADFLGTEELVLSVNSNIDGCIVSSNMTITVNVSLVKNYEMFSALDANGTCHPYVTDGNITRGISDISFYTEHCYSEFDDGYDEDDEYKKVGSKFVFNFHPDDPLYRVNPANLGFSSWNRDADTYWSLVVSRKFPILNTPSHEILWNYENALVYTSDENDAGLMPWGIKTTGDSYLIEDVVGENSSDEIKSNYMQDYSYFDGMRLGGEHIYSVGYDNDNGNGMSLNKSCAFEGIETCSSGESYLYPNTGSSTVFDVSLAVDKSNFIYVFDENNHSLWITIDLNLKVLGMRDETRLMEDVNFTSMDFQRAKNGVVYYDGYNADTQHREIGYFYEKKTPLFPAVKTYPADWSEAHRESSDIDDFFKDTTLVKKIVDIDSTGDFFVAGNKVYVSKQIDWYELDMNGTLTKLPSQTGEDPKAEFRTINTMKYINGYIYMIGWDIANKPKMVVVDTENNNTVTLLEFDKYVTLYTNGLYKNDYNFHKVIYRTRESDGNGAYIYKVYGYNPYKNEKTLLKKYTLQD